MKIQIQSLRVINCGPLRDVCIHFNTDGDSPVTVLAGANGSGKTTVLKLAVAFAEMLVPLSELPPRRIEQFGLGYAQMDWLVDGQLFSTFYGKKPENVKLAENYYGRSGMYAEAMETSGPIASAIEERIRLQEASPIPLHLFGRNNPGKPKTEQMLFTLPSILFFDHTRVILPITGDQIFREDVAYQWVYFYQIAQKYEGSLDSYLIWLEYTDPETFENVTMFLNHLDFEGKTFSISRRDLKVEVTTRNGGTHFLEALSSGEQNILIMLMELRRRLLPHSIVLIDEIENSLHPAFQHRIVNGLKRLQELIPFQLIVTSHSLAILEAFGPQSARILTQF